MGVFCVTCNVVIPGDLNAFSQHLKKRDHVPPYLCAEGQCNGRTFVERKSLYRHLREQHVADLHPDPPVVAEFNAAFVPLGVQHEQENEEGEGNEGEEHEDNEGDEFQEDKDDSSFSDELKKSVALMILNLRKHGNIPGSAISQMLEGAHRLLRDAMNVFKKEISKNLKNLGVSENVVAHATNVEISPSIFKHLRTKEQQMSYFERHFGLVRPVQKFIGYRPDQRFNPATNEADERQASRIFQYVPIIDTLTAVLKNSTLYKLIHTETASTDGLIRTFLDGSLVEGNLLIQRYPHTLRIVLYVDEFECVNPLGSKTSKHKITGVYFVIQNLPPEENSRLRSVHVLVYSYTQDFDVDRGVDSILEPVFADLKRLESDEGVPIKINNQHYVLRATLIAVAGDSAAAHDILGMLSTSASCFCRYCVVTRKDLHNDIFSKGEERSAELHLQHIEEVTLEGEVAQKRTGVKRDSLLRKSCRYALVPKVATFDGMHDILKGVAAMEMKLALHEFVIVKKTFDIDLLNSRIVSFQYGPQDSKNKPSPNFTYSSLNNLGSYTICQSAAQTWCLLRAFVFLVTPEVSPDSPHLKLVSLLKRISDIVFCTAVSEGDLDMLQSLLLEHHHLFFVLYPPLAAEGNVQAEEEENEMDEEQIDGELQVVNIHREDQRKRKKVIRPINKHHHLLHYLELFRKFGSPVLYWCMRFEAKHAIAKRYAAICCNFKNLCLTLADMHQINHAAEIYEISCAVQEEVSAVRGSSIKTASNTEHHQALFPLGIRGDDVVTEVEEGSLGGFHYRRKFFVTLPIKLNNLPVFGQIQTVIIFEKELVVTVEFFKTIKFDSLYGAFLIQKENNAEIKAFHASSIQHAQPMSPWRRYGHPDLLYISPRRSLVDSIFMAIEQNNL